MKLGYRRWTVVRVKLRMEHAQNLVSSLVSDLDRVASKDCEGILWVFYI